MADPIERREVKDPNASLQAAQPGSVPLAPVMAPRPSSMKAVGNQERELAGLLNQANLGFTKFMDKKKAEWSLQGQMAYAEGKTEEEVVASGNRFTTAGYMSMKARTAGNVWLQQALSDIEDSDKMLDSKTYQAKLSAQYKEMVDQTAGQDEFTRNLMTAIAEESFPRLVAQQIKSNNAYREQETYNSYSTLLVSEADRFDPADPEAASRVEELLDPSVSGLNPELHAKAVTEAITSGLELDNDKLAQVVGATTRNKLDTLDSQSGLPSGLLRAVLSTESNGKRYAKDGSVLTSKKGAKGEMQVMDGTNRDPGFGVTPAKDDSLDERARVGRDYLTAMMSRYNDPVLAVMAYNAGPGTVDKHIAQVGVPGTGGELSHKDFVSSFPFKETRDYVRKINGELTGAMKGVESRKAALVSDLTDRGFSLAQITSITKSYDAYQKRQADKFDKGRIMAEQTILSTVESDGNLPQALDQIQAMRDANGYDDGWANGMAAKAVSAQATWEKENEKTMEIQTAIANNNMATLSGDKQDKAIELEKNRIIGEVQAQEGLSDEEKGMQIRDLTADMLIKNNIVDKKWAASMEAVLSGNILNKDGTVTEEAVQAYDDYLLFSKQGNPGYASKYLGAAKDIVAIAETYDGGGGLDSATALKIAAEQVQRMRNDPNWKPPTYNPAEIKRQTNAWIDKMDVSWFSGIAGKQYRSAWNEVLDTEIAQAKKDPRLGAMVEDLAARHSARGMSETAAIKLATDELQNRAEYAMGNIVLSGKQSSIREDMGIAHSSEPTAVNKALYEYLAKYGEVYWGQTFKDAQTQFYGNDPTEKDPAFFGLFGKDVTREGSWAARGESIAMSARGVPPVYITYNADAKAFMVDLYTNMERTSVANAPKLIPAQEIGDFANQTIFQPRSWLDFSVPEWKQ